MNFREKTKYFLYFLIVIFGIISLDKINYLFLTTPKDLFFVLLSDTLFLLGVYFFSFREVVLLTSLITFIYSFFFSFLSLFSLIHFVLITLLGFTIKNIKLTSSFEKYKNTDIMKRYDIIQNSYEKQEGQATNKEIPLRNIPTTTNIEDNLSTERDIKPTISLSSTQEETKKSVNIDIMSLFKKEEKEKYNSLKDIILEYVRKNDGVEYIEQILGDKINNKNVVSINQKIEELVKNLKDEFFMHHIFFGGTGAGKTYLMKQLTFPFLKYLNNVLVLDAKASEFIQLLFPLKFSINSYDDLKWAEKYIDPESLKKWYEEGFKEKLYTIDGREIMPIVYLADTENTMRIKKAIKKFNINAKVIDIHKSKFNLLDFTFNLPSSEELEEIIELGGEINAEIIIDDKILTDITDEEKMKIINEFGPYEKVSKASRKGKKGVEDYNVILKFILKLIAYDFYFKFLIRDSNSKYSKIIYDLYELIIFRKKLFTVSDHDKKIEEIITKLRENFSDFSDNFFEKVLELFIKVVYDINISYKMLKDEGIELRVTDWKESVENVYLKSIKTKNFFNKTSILWNNNNKKVYLIFVYSPETEETTRSLKIILGKRPSAGTVLILDELLNAMRSKSYNAKILGKLLMDGLNKWRSLKISLFILHQDVPTAQQYEVVNINDIMKGFKNKYFFNVSGKAGMENYLVINAQELSVITNFQNKLKTELKSKGLYVNLWFGVVQYIKGSKGFLYNEQYKVPHIKPDEFLKKLE